MLTHTFSFFLSLLYHLVLKSTTIYHLNYKKQVNKENPKTERDFEKIIDNLSSVTWWIKNPDYGMNGLSLVYEDPSNSSYLSEFYPDYVVRFSNGDVGIYETKSFPDRDEIITNEKSTVLDSYLSDLNSQSDGINYYGGIVHLIYNRETDSYTLKSGDFKSPSI